MKFKEMSLQVKRFIMWVSKDKDEFRQVGRVSDWNNILKAEKAVSANAGAYKITHLVIRSNFVQLKYSLEMRWVAD